MKRKALKVQLEYPVKGHYGSKVYPLPREPRLAGLTVDIYDDEVLPQDTELPVSTGLKQVHISGSPKALRDLGEFLLGIAENRTPVGFISHFDPIRNTAGEPAVHLVIHHKKRDHGRTTRIL